MDHHQALKMALLWAERAERAAKNYPSIPSADLVHVQVAQGMSTMWTKLSQELYGTTFAESEEVVDIALPDVL